MENNKIKFITDKNNLTAVEWLCNELHKYINGESNFTGVEIKEQAIQMEKEQIINFFLFFRNNGEKYLGMTIEQFVEQYYKETYGK